MKRVTQNPKTYIRETLIRYLDKEKIDFFLFGSRASGQATSKSDRDIGLKAQNKKAIAPSLIQKIKGSFEESPYRVDIIDFNTVEESFRKIASQHIIKL